MEHKGLYTGLGIMALVTALGFKREAGAVEPILVQKMKTISKTDVSDVVPEPVTPIPIRPVQKEITPVVIPQEQPVSEALDTFLSLQVVQVDPVSLTPPETPLIQLPEQIQEVPINAEYQIPLYNIANRDVVYHFFNKMTALGVSLEDIKKIDVGSIPTKTWLDMGANIAFTTLCAFAGPIGWITGAIQGIVDYIKMRNSPSVEELRRAEQAKVDAALNAFRSFYRQHKISSRPCFLLGTLAKNRIGSYLVPLIKVRNETLMDETYVTADMLPVFSQGGYTSDGRTLGFISSIPFPKSVLIKLMFSFEMMDFVMVADGSELERVLTYARYFPITNLGYVSHIIQPGQQGLFTKDFEIVESVQTLDQQSRDFLLDYRSLNTPFYKYLRENVALPITLSANTLSNAGLSKMVFESRPIANIAHGPAFISHKPGARGIPPLEPRLAITELLAKNKVHPLYEAVNKMWRPEVPPGTIIPPIGKSSRIILSTDKNIIWVHQLNGALVQIWLPKEISGLDQLQVLGVANVLAKAPRSKYALRILLGNFYKSVNKYSVYEITSIDTLKQNLSRYNSKTSLWIYDSSSRIHGR